MGMKIALGVDNFEKLMSEKFYYTDKTGFIKELLDQSFEVNLITRPRRFGKTLAMSMLAHFFDIRKDSRKDFEGLEISRDMELCSEWMNQWPVIFFSLKSVEGTTFDSAYGMLKVMISDLCKEYAYLVESLSVDPDDKNIFLELKAQRADDNNLRNSLKILMRMMYSYYKKPVILLIDEYDVPLARASETGYYDEMADVVRTMLGSALKTNDYLKFAVITGCLKIAKESIFSGLNNLVSNSITDKRFHENFGFTESDVRKLLRDIGQEQHMDEIREWYDGYRFGGVHIYCPWDVLNYVAALRSDPDAEPETYWVNTSSNNIIKRFLQKSVKQTRQEIEKLIAGGTVVKTINEQLTYNELDQSIDHLWSVLYTTGYLTLYRKYPGGKMELGIPNREIKEIYVSQIREWFQQEVVNRETDQFTSLCNALKNGNSKEVEKQFNYFLGKSISIRDTNVRKGKKENFYHGLLLGMLALVEDWYVRSNVEDGDGYSDIHIEIEGEDTAVVIEMKYAENDDLDAGCQKALRQIQTMRYAAELQDSGYGTVYVYGIACYKKHCRVVCGT